MLYIASELLKTFGGAAQYQAALGGSRKSVFALKTILEKVAKAFFPKKQVYFFPKTGVSA